MTLFVGSINAILSIGGGYFLATLGWVLLYKGTRTLNFAAGQFYLLGPCILVWVSGAIANNYFAAVVALLISGAVGGLTYMLFVKRMVGQPEFSLVVLTLGLSIVLQVALTLVFGTGDRLGVSLAGNGSLISLDHQVLLSDNGLLAVVCALIMFVIVELVLHRTKVGIRSRAMGENPWLASQSRVSIRWTGAAIWALGIGGVALGGMVYASGSVVNVSLSDIGLLGIAPALIGGLDSVSGALIGSAIAALVEYLGGYFLGGNNEEAALFAVVLVFLFLRPTGLFGSAEMTRA